MSIVASIIVYFSEGKETEKASRNTGPRFCMSLNNIILPTSLLAELYRRSLVDGPVRPANVSSRVPFLGNYEKAILILVHHPKTSFLPDKELTFLTTVLSACGLGLTHVAIVNTAAVNEEQDIVAQFSPKEILLLNVSPAVAGLPPDVPAYAVQGSRSVQYVHAPSLTEVEKTKQSKSKLWVALKQLFCLQ